MYTLAYRNLGIFQENVVNRFLQDIVKAVSRCGDSYRRFHASRWIATKITATYPAQKEVPAEARGGSA